MGLVSWAEVASRSGPPQTRRFEENPRLFNASKPEVIFWRDNSAWCPYCCRLWLLLEAMRLPYRMKTIPLRAYLKPGEHKPREFTAMVPSGVVPALQFRVTDDSETTDDSDASCFGPAVEGVQHLISVLERKYPGAFPGRPSGESQDLKARCYDEVVRDGGVRDAFEIARRAYETCAGAPVQFRGDTAPQTMRPASYYFEVTGLVDACRRLDAVLAISGGPFVCGAQPTAADWQILPLLERAEVVPFYFWGPDAVDSDVFQGARRLLNAARDTTFFRHYASDPTTLARTNVRYAPRGFEPSDRKYAALVDADPKWLRDATPDACRDAAARLAKNRAAVANFALRSSESGDDDDKSILAAVDLALRVVASALVRRAASPGSLADSSSSESSFSEKDVAAAVARDCDAAGFDRMREPHLGKAADALAALALNVGVPRDMDQAPANALRAYTRLVADTLRASSSGASSVRV